MLCGLKTAPAFHRWWRLAEGMEVVVTVPGAQRRDAEQLEGTLPLVLPSGSCDTRTPTRTHPLRWVLRVNYHMLSATSATASA
jgi:hypothetical protein